MQNLICGRIGWLEKDQIARAQINLPKEPGAVFGGRWGHSFFQKMWSYKILLRSLVFCFLIAPLKILVFDVDEYFLSGGHWHPHNLLTCITCILKESICLLKKSSQKFPSRSTKKHSGLLITRTKKWVWVYFKRIEKRQVFLNYIARK